MFKGRSEMHKRGVPHVCECCCMSIVALEIECSKHVNSFSFFVDCIYSFEEEEYSTHVVGFFFCIGF